MKIRLKPLDNLAILESLYVEPVKLEKNTCSLLHTFLKEIKQD